MEQSLSSSTSLPNLPALASASASPSSSSAASTSTPVPKSWFSGIVRSHSLKIGGNSGLFGKGDIGSPVVVNHQFRGVLFKYGPKPIQVAFKTGDYKQQVVFVAGLTDGFLATEYLERLAIALDKEKWSLVQFLLSSSYGGYGTSTLQQDATEIDHLISYLINKDESAGVVLLGHGTGCQDIVYYVRTNATCSKAVRSAILQAPFSDREYRATLPKTAALIDLAAKMIIEGRGSELMPREADPNAPMTANRYHSLCSYNGEEDMFSSDLSDSQLKLVLGHMSKLPCQVIFSMADEYVPEYVDKKALAERLCKAMGGAEKLELEHGIHSLSNRVEEVVRAVINFVKRGGPKGWDDPWK